MDKEKKPIIIETADIYLHFPYIIEEEADDLADFLEEEHIEYEGATDIFIDLQNQVKKQKAQIEKYQKALDETMSEKIDIQNNWNKLKEIIKKKQDYYRHFKDNRYRKFLSELLDIMQEKEQGSDSNDSN